MSNYPMIGVIGGAGVAASVELMDRFERYYVSKGAVHNQEHPEIVLYQATQAPSRSLFLEGRGESFIPDYIRAAKHLKAIGANFLCMSCNTAHYAIHEISQAANIEILNMIEVTFEKIHSQNNSALRVGVLCSEGSGKAGLFESAATKILGDQCSVIQVECAMQEVINKAISNVRIGEHRQKSIKSADHPLSMLLTPLEDLWRKKCDVVILGCTEISLAFNDYPLSENIIDSLDVLVERASIKYDKLLKERKV